MVAPKSSLFWRFFNTSVKGHTAAFRLTNGRLGGRVVGSPVLLLHHVGAKSGKKRISPLLYMSDGDRFVIVASKGGYTKHPGWFHNLMANGDTVVEVPREGKVPVRARKASSEERGALWPRVVDQYSGYEAYQRSTEREIPLVILERR
ncbi:MAG TPA: nitroreductase family deazaflavin-dependent oxidoreductase [Thermoleophilaceae bacterium]|nr:nitroreductase family deazaflavin-dependent oxidoreductase [Thermoleophilaceae bacterium]